MTVPATRNDMKEYCLRRLGKPVIQINVSDTQVEDRIDEALDYWRNFHHDAVQKVPFKHVLTANNITNQYIDTNSDIIGINRILPGAGSGNSGRVNMFDIRYQTRLNDFLSYRMTEMLDMYLMQTHLNMIDEAYVGAAPIAFNKHMNRLYLYWDWESDAIAGEYIIIEATVAIDGATFTDIWSDRMLQRYATALIKQQWGSNLSKFTQTQLIGGQTYNGEKIWQDATEEIKALEEEIRLTYEEPPAFFTG